jgi:hypothetical protein
VSQLNTPSAFHRRRLRPIRLLRLIQLIRLLRLIQLIRLLRLIRRGQEGRAGPLLSLWRVSVAYPYPAAGFVSDMPKLKFRHSGHWP